MNSGVHKIPFGVLVFTAQYCNNKTSVCLE